ncbi:MAG: hypothetical protein HQL56_13915 [Magnetococcales bacterium]|nr:hypothetical protein [Magnetococcales bacterium]
MSYGEAKRYQPFPSLPEDGQNSPNAQPAIPDWRIQQQREDNQLQWVENRAAQIRQETGWDTRNPAAEVQATFDSHEHARKHGAGIWDLPGGIPQPKWANDAENTLPGIPGNKLSSRKPAIPKWDFGASNDADDLWESPELQRGLNRLALQDIGRQHPDWDLSILEPMARGGALADVGNLLKGMTGQRPHGDFPNMMMAAAETTQNEGGGLSGYIKEWVKSLPWWFAEKAASLIPNPFIRAIAKESVATVRKKSNSTEETVKGMNNNSGHSVYEGCAGRSDYENCVSQASAEFEKKQEEKAAKERAIELENMKRGQPAPPKPPQN